MTASGLLVMDVQRGITDHFTDNSDYLSRLRRIINGARDAGMLVIYVVINFRDGYPEVSRSNKGFSAIAGTGRFSGKDPGVDIHQDVAPWAGDIVVAKRRVSAFAGSDLDMVLRARGIDTLVLTGISTSGVVLSTVRQAADLDYQLIILEDGCLDSDSDVHELLMSKVFPRQAEVLTADSWLASI